MLPKICSIPECGKPHKGHGWCQGHLQKYRKYGNPLAGRTKYNSPQKALAARTSKSGDCLLWTGSKDRGGYGTIQVSGRTVGAHRFAWENANGPIPDGMSIDHICHNRDCVLPDHLRLATHKENTSYLSGPLSNNTSGFRNVYAKNSGWEVSVGKDGKTHYFGIYSSIEEAAKVAESARVSLFGKFAGKG